MSSTNAANVQPAELTLPDTTETGALGVYQLKRMWARTMARRQGRPVAADTHERQLDVMVVHACGLGLEQTATYLGHQAPAFEEFERWIIDTTGGLAAERIARINAAVAGRETPPETKLWLSAIEASADVFTADDLAFWNEHGYVVLHNAVPAENCAAAAQALWNYLGAQVDNPDSWYKPNDHGIMVQYFQHPAFEANRRGRRVHKAFAQLWGTADLWVTTDRVGFNPPERPGFKFRGPDLHWDISVKTPIPFGTGGILYLTDTPPQQGAFTVVPGFQRWGEEWLKSLPPGANPREQNLHALGSRPIGGRAGDLIIWQLALPHGASANRGSNPRMVQYINMFPTHYAEQEEWR